MLQLPPEAYGLELADDDVDMRNALRYAIRELRRIEESNTPKLKLKQVGKAIKIVTVAFTLYRVGEQVVADTLNLYLPYLLVQA